MNKPAEIPTRAAVELWLNKNGHPVEWADFLTGLPWAYISYRLTKAETPDRRYSAAVLVYTSEVPTTPQLNEALFGDPNVIPHGRLVLR